MIDETVLPELNLNHSEVMHRLEEMIKKYNDVRAKNMLLEKENERLFKENQILKRNTIRK